MSVNQHLPPSLTAASLSDVGPLRPGEIFMKRMETRLVVREVVLVNKGRVRFVEGRSVHGRRATGRSVDLDRWKNWAAEARRLERIFQLASKKMENSKILTHERPHQTSGRTRSPFLEPLKHSVDREM